MRCIFCKKNSKNSVSIEHVIPESLGNSKLILPKGAVCDSCNNYFATHLEKQVLESGEFSYLRFNQELRNKRGKVPEVDILFGDHIVKARRLGKLEFAFGPDDFNKIQKYLSKSNKREMKIPVTGESPDDVLTSRWLAKMALEMLAHKWLKIDRWNDQIVEHEGLNPIRQYARAPMRGETWNYSKRRIYDNNAKILAPNGQRGQMLYECDILATGTAESSEFYFVVAFFGMEYAINIGGNSMDGYYEWLKCHNDVSPLYIRNNSVEPVSELEHR
ncbi:MAG: HNH endonuclease [Smithella sp.]